MARKGENIRKRKDGRWEARIIENGKTKYLYASSYKEVKDKKKNYSFEVIPKLKLTLSDVISEWLKFIKPQVKESTYYKYLSVSKKHIEPYLGSVQIQSLSNEIINNYTNVILTKDNLRNGKDLKETTVINIISVLKSILKFSKDSGYSKELTVKNPKLHHNEITVISDTDINLIINRIADDRNPVYIGILLSLYMGLRIGEVSALKWSDIDLVNNTLEVSKTISRVDDIETHKTKIIISKPKSESSVRTIPIPDFLAAYLKERKQNDEYFVLSSTDKCIEPRLLYKYYKNLLKSLNIDKYNYHALRHTFATKCIDNSFDIKTLSEILGHSSVEITLQRYVHPTIDMKRRQMNLIENPFKKKNKK